MKEKPFMLLPLLIISSMEQRPLSEADGLSSTQQISAHTHILSRWYLHLVVVEGLVSSSNPES
jgi:hypothetical protein